MASPATLRWVSRARSRSAGHRSDHQLGGSSARSASSRASSTSQVAHLAEQAGEPDQLVLQRPGARGVEHGAYVRRVLRSRRTATRVGWITGSRCAGPTRRRSARSPARRGRPAPGRPRSVGWSATDSLVQSRSVSKNSVRSRAARCVPPARARSASRSSTRRILPLIVLGRSVNSSRRIRLYGARCSRAVGQDRPRRLRVRREAVGQHHVRLGHRQPQVVRGRHHGRFGHRRVLDQHRLQLERADPVVAGLEHVVGPSDEGQVAVRVAGAPRPRCGRRRRRRRPRSGRRRTPRPAPRSRSSAAAVVAPAPGTARPRRPGARRWPDRPGPPGSRAAAGPSTRPGPRLPGGLPTCAVVSVCP